MPTDLALQYNYIRKGSEDNLLLTRREGYINSFKHYYFINIEKISGDISLINFNNKIEYYCYKNMHLFKSREEKYLFLSLKIKAEKNSVYCIKYYHLSDVDQNQAFYTYLLGSNFLFNVNLKSIKMLTFTPNYLFEKYFIEEVAIYLNVILINCTTDDFIDFNATKFPPYQYSNLNYSFYQLIMEPDVYVGTYSKFFRLFPSLGSCFVYVSNNYFPTNYSDSYDYIQILEENFPKAVVFNKTYNKYFFAFFFGETDKDLKIKFYPLNNGKFELNLFINDLELEKKYDITKKGNINLNNSSWKDICEDEKQMCKLTFSLLAKNTDKDYSIEITINPEGGDWDGDIDGDDDDNKNKTILIIIISVFGSFLIIIIIILIILRCKKKNNKIREDIENIPLVQ